MNTPMHKTPQKVLFPLRCCVAIRHPGQVRLRWMRAGIQKRIWLYWPFTGFRISLREAKLVRNDGFGELWHSVQGEKRCCWAKLIVVFMNYPGYPWFSWLRLRWQSPGVVIDSVHPETLDQK